MFVLFYVNNEISMNVKVSKNVCIQSFFVGVPIFYFCRVKSRQKRPKMSGSIADTWLR